MIAARLRSGDFDPVFLQILAQMIDPHSTHHIFGARFDLIRTKGPRRPLAPVDWDLAHFLEKEIASGVKAEAVFALAKEKFGVGRTKCTKLLAKLR